MVTLGRIAASVLNFTLRWHLPVGPWCRLSLTGALVVVTPQDAAHLDAKKVLAMFEQLGVPVVGGIDNMSGLSCPCCNHVIEVFEPVAPERSIWAMGVERLVQIPVHRSVAGAGGRPLLVEHPERAEAEAFRTLARRLKAWAGEALGRDPSHGG